jgi:hypothetical protein
MTPSEGGKQWILARLNIFKLFPNELLIWNLQVLTLGCFHVSLKGCLSKVLILPATCKIALVMTPTCPIHSLFWDKLPYQSAVCVEHCYLLTLLLPGLLIGRLCCRILIPGGDSVLRGGENNKTKQNKWHSLADWAVSSHRRGAGRHLTWRLGRVFVVILGRR